jgi:trehalose 6-phosphate phosphatase
LNYVFRSLGRIQSEVSKASRIYVFLDYDGTLTPIVDNPEDALLQEKFRRLLRILASRQDCILSIVSGRRLDALKKLVKLQRIYYVGNHGFEIEGPGMNFVHPRARELSRELRLTSNKIRTQLKGIRSELEDKGLTTSVHYRNTPASDVNRLLRTVKNIVSERAKLKLAYDKKVVEIRPRINWDKGAAVRLIMRTLGRGLPIYIGDDRTDEDAFVRIKSGITILVSRRRKRSNAKYYLKNVADVYKFLSLLLVAVDARDPSSFSPA